MSLSFGDTFQLAEAITNPGGGLYGEASPERGTFFRLLVYKSVGISQIEVYKRVGKSFI